MTHLIIFIPLLPLLSSLLLGILGRTLSKKWIDGLACGSLVVSFLITGVLAILLEARPETRAYPQLIAPWIRIDTPTLSFHSDFILRLDALSVILCGVVTFVGFLIHLYSTDYITASDEGYSRYFACLNLFVSSMLFLVLAGDLLFLYLGWEGVGLCSYLLIGFWYQDPSNGRAARKAMLVTRVGDTAMAIGIFLLFWNLNTLEIQPMLERAKLQWTVGSPTALLASALLLIGALGKSAQLPLQTWLPDAMAGPTPVSALIHAATMVAAGVYLIARTHTLFELAPIVQVAMAIVGALTLVFFSLSALTQSDLKKILAYSTISQIGYMFLALGVQAWSAAIFHFVTHAVFKALLFLGAGAVISFMGHEQNIFRMGGLKRDIPIVFWTFLMGAFSLAALPIVSSGFFSKDLILEKVFNSHPAGPLLWMIGIFGAGITALYSFRLVFLVFLGDTRPSPHPVLPHLSLRILAPLVILAFLSIVIGWLEIPSFLDPLFGVTSTHPHSSLERLLPWIASAVSLAGVAIADLFYRRRREIPERFIAHFRHLHSFLKSGWGFDRLYDQLFVRPWLFLCLTLRRDFIDSFFEKIARFQILFHRALSRTQTGNLRLYLTVLGTGAAVLVAITEALWRSF